MKKDIILFFLILSFLFTACNHQNTAQETAAATNVHLPEDVSANKNPVENRVDVSNDTEETLPTEVSSIIKPTETVVIATEEYFENSDEGLGWS